MSMFITKYKLLITLTEIQDPRQNFCNFLKVKFN